MKSSPTPATGGRRNGGGHQDPSVTLRQAATECYWRAWAVSRPAGQGDDAVADARIAASFRARKDLALIALNARGRGWTRLAEEAHLALLQDRGLRGLAGRGRRA